MRTKGPGIYSDIGKNARDLLYKDYFEDHKFIFTTCSPTGIAITSSATKKGDALFMDINTQLERYTQLRERQLSYDIKVNTNSVLFLTATTDDIIPGFKTVATYSIPDQLVSKCEMQYFHKYAGISISHGIGANPIDTYSAVVGTKVAKIGADVAIDNMTSKVTKCNVGLSLSSEDLIAALAVNDKGDTLNASYYHIVQPLTNTAVGAEVNHCFSTNECTITVGTQHSLDPLTTVKARVNNFGKASALIQHDWRPKSLVTLSGEVDTKAIDKSAKFGLGLTLKS